MPLYYKHNNYASFQRQLNNFGYHRKFAHFVVNNSGQLDTVYHKLGTPMSSNIEELLHLRPVLERTSDKKREEEARQQGLPPTAAGAPDAPASNGGATSPRADQDQDRDRRRADPAESAGAAAPAAAPADGAPYPPPLGPPGDGREAPASRKRSRGHSLDLSHLGPSLAARHPIDDFGAPYAPPYDYDKGSSPLAPYPPPMPPPPTAAAAAAAAAPPPPDAPQSAEPAAAQPDGEAPPKKKRDGKDVVAAVGALLSLGSK